MSQRRKNTTDTKNGHSDNRGLNQKATKHSVFFLQMLHAHHVLSFTADAREKWSLLVNVWQKVYLYSREVVGYIGRRSSVNTSGSSL